MSGDDHVARVRAYYEDNIHRFLKFGQSGSANAIRRAVWGPAAENRTQALEYVNALILAELDAIPRLDYKNTEGDVPTVLDMGCGVGGSLFYLARRRALRGLGVNVGAEQITIAREKAKQASDTFAPGAACDFLEADYLKLPASRDFNLAYSVEAFTCGPDGRAFFQAAAKALKPGGILIICDDFLSPAVGDSAVTDTNSKSHARILDEFRAGWHAKTLINVREAHRLAAEAGFARRGEGDLTPYLELRRPRDYVISVLTALGRFLPLHGPAWRNMLGGNALQAGLLKGLLEYRFLIYRKTV